LPHWIAANSRTAIDNLRLLGFNPAKFLLIPNAVDTEWFQPAKRTRTGSEFVILGIGSLEPVKRFDRLLEISGCLSAKTKRRVRLVIAGSGSQRDSIEQKAEQVRNRGVRVDLAGRVADPLNVFQSADVLALTSDREGTPNVIMEAMACALPVVATKLGGVPDLVRHGETGFLFEPENTRDAVSALQRLADEPELAAEMGYRARSFVETDHSINGLSDRLTDLYRTVLDPALPAKR
jgi:glycosyltransferase involved in cell wall biosynthesis